MELGKVEVSILSLNGDLLQLDISHQTTLGALKDIIHGELAIHPLCQQLTSGDELLVDHARSVASYVAGFQDAKLLGATLNLTATLVVVTDAAFAQLASPDPDDCLAAIEALSSRFFYGNEKCMEALVRLLSRPRVVCIAAVKALRIVTPKGSKHVVDALVESSQSRCQHEDVKKAIVEALGDIATEGDAPTIAAVAKQLCSKGITSAAGDALMQLAPWGDTRTASIMLDILDDASVSAVELKQTALKVLARVTIPGNIDCLEKISHHLKDVVPAVREETLRTLGQVAPVAHKDTIKLLISTLLSDWNTEVKKAAVTALGKVAQHGDDDAIEALCICVEREFADIRNTSAGFLVKIAPLAHIRANQVLAELYEG